MKEIRDNISREIIDCLEEGCTIELLDLDNKDNLDEFIIYRGTYIKSYPSFMLFQHESGIKEAFLWKDIADRRILVRLK